MQHDGRFLSSPRRLLGHGVSSRDQVTVVKAETRFLTSVYVPEASTTKGLL